ncbi:MAG TPA: hypothetical protein VKA60_26400 [Blastocatellia bacterium]|nr:hypothetical protein [Blastocatellia bacterium]
MKFLTFKQRTALPSAAATGLLVAVLLLASACKGNLLDERFHSDDLSGWTVVDDPETVEGPSLWRVEADGWLHQRSNIWGRRGDFIGRWYGTMNVAGDAGWRDYTFSVKAKANDNDGFGVVFRYRDGEHFYRLLLLNDGMSGGPLARLDKREGADYTELWSAARGYREHAELLIEITAEGDHLQGKLDGQPLFDLRDPSYRSGKVGLFCYAQSDQAFDDVRVIGR